MRAFLQRDRTLDVVVVPKVTRVTVTRPRLHDGRALGDDAIERIFEMLALSQIDQPYAGIDDLRRACEPRSLAEMAWDLAALADGGGRASRARVYPEWMRRALTHLADDEVIRRLYARAQAPDDLTVCSRRSRSVASARRRWSSRRRTSAATLLS